MSLIKMMLVMVSVAAISKTFGLLRFLLRLSFLAKWRLLPHLLTLWVCKLLMLICILTKNVITSCSVTMMLFLHLQGKALLMPTRLLSLSPGAIRPPLVHRPRGARAAPERWLADGGARRRARRLQDPGLEGRRLVPRAGDPHSPAALGDRGGTEGPVLPLRKAPAALRQGHLPRALQLEVRLAGEADQLLRGDPHQHHPRCARGVLGLGGRRRRPRGQLEARPRHHRRPRPRRERPCGLAHPARARLLLAPASDRAGPLTTPGRATMRHPAPGV